MLKSRQLILAKIQSAAGVDPVPTPGDNAILASKMEFSLIGRRMERAAALQWMGAKPPLNIGDGLKIKFETEVRGRGLGVAPDVGPLLRACNLSEAIVADTKVIYTPNSKLGAEDNSELVAFYFYQDKIWHKLLNARGTVSTSMKSAEYPMDSWEFTGTYGGAAHVASIPAGVFDQTVPPRFTSALCTIGGYSPKFETLTLDLGNKVVQRKDGNAPSGVLEWMISDRAPKGSIDPEVPDLTTASLTTAFAAANSNLKFSAVEQGVGGNDVHIFFHDSGGAVSVTVADKVITINVHAGVTLASAVKAAYDLVPAAVALATCDYKTGDNGSGAVEALVSTPLADGAGLDFWKKWEDSAGMAITATVGQTAGNKCKFTVSNAVLEAPTYAERENILTHGLSFTIHPGPTGNDEIIREYS